MDLGAIFKDLVWDVLVRVALSKLFQSVPFLGWGPLGMLVGWAVGIFGSMLFEAVREAVQLEVIVLRNEAHRKAFAAAATNLKAIARDKGPDSNEFKEARDAHRKALSEFVQFH